MLAARRHAASTPSPLLLRRLSAQPQPKAPVPPPPPPPPSDEGAAAWARRAVALSLLGLTGAVAASAFSDLSVFLSCSSQAMEKATKNQQVASAIGEPITRGPWYSASIAVNRARRSVSCTFPVSGPQGDGLLKFKAVRLGEESWFRFLQRSDWEILIMHAILDVRTEDGKHQTMRVMVADNTAAPPPPADCRTCKPRTTPTPKPKPTPVPTPMPTSAPPPAQEK
ncbi:hypothetical protein VPH35_017861 [Triticum aestivum]|uniref:Mitochondrial import inner membrane translocase subunit Tim21 n=1 Tax=Triticum turgidum subsp. durum TaxID=4567 RepID=A0A9R1NGA1_TRITD|nr:cAMP-specific 3',5'-cyclic phosphodiesterase 4D-like [Triticum aestivum]VAH24344.1 unnamed protein product [Triticum turgidum subsp. durum]